MLTMTGRRNEGLRGSGGRKAPRRAESGSTSGAAHRCSALAGFLLASSVLTGCAAGRAAPVGTPVPDPSATAVALAEATAPTEPRQITFSWRLDESGSRVSGRGVVRLQPPDRLRLDLFGPRNETVLAAAMVGEQVRMPAAVRTDVAIPSPALLWGGVGAIRPPSDATLQSATAAEGVTVLRYATEDGEVYEYTVGDEPQPRLREVQRLGSRGPLETVGLEWSETGEITRASYRDWAAYRNLTLEIEQNVVAQNFPEQIWTP